MALHSMCQPGRPFSPGAGPEDGAILRHARLPEGKIPGRFLGVLVVAHPLAGLQLVEIQVHQLPVAVSAGAVFLEAEIDRAFRGAVGQAPGH